MIYLNNIQFTFLLFCIFSLVTLACNSETNHPQTEISNPPTIVKDTISSAVEHATHEEIVKKQKVKSILKNKKCDEILQKYEADIKKYLNSRNDNDLLEIAEWANDPIFENCKKESAYKKQFDQLDELLME